MTPKSFRNPSRESPLRFENLAKTGKFWYCGTHSHPPMAIEVKFCTAKRTHMPVSPAKFDVNRCNLSPLRGEKPDFLPVSKFNAGVCRFAAILPVTTKDNAYRHDIVTCICCYTRVELIRLLIVSIRSISRNYAAEFLRFWIFPPHISDSCGATYLRNCKMFTGCKAHLVLKRIAKSMHNWRRYPSSNWYEIDQKTRF